MATRSDTVLEAVLEAARETASATALVTPSPVAGEMAMVAEVTGRGSVEKA